MTGSAGFTEHELHAFADGELDPAARTDIETWLAEHPDDAARVRELRQHREDLRAAFDDVLDEPVPPALTAALQGRANRARSVWWPRAAAAVVLFAVGLGAGWTLRGRQQPAGVENFVRQAVSAHVVHVAEKRHAVEVQAKEERHLVAWLSKRLHHRIKAPVLADIGFRLVGGRMVADQGVPAAQFMYEDAGGRRVTIYTRRTGDTGETAFHFVGRGEISAFYWIEAPLAFALIGRMRREELLPIAKRVYKELEP